MSAPTPHTQRPHIKTAVTDRGAHCAGNIERPRGPHCASLGQTTDAAVRLQIAKIGTAEGEVRAGLKRLSARSHAERASVSQPATRGSQRPSFGSRLSGGATSALSLQIAAAARPGTSAHAATCAAPRVSWSPNMDLQELQAQTGTNAGGGGGS